MPVFPGRQTETPRFRLAVTTAITTSWLGVVVQDFLPHPTSCVPMILHLARLGIEPSPLADSNHAAHGYHRQMDYAVSTENWRGMLESNQLLRRGKKRKALQLAPYNNAACAPVFPSCQRLYLTDCLITKTPIPITIPRVCLRGSYPCFCPQKP